VDEQRITPDTNSTNNEAVLRILEPASKNLVSIESARVFNVYDQMLKQMNILLNLEKIYKFLESEMPLKEIASRSSIFARIDGILGLRKEFVKCPDDLSIEDRIKSESRHLCRTFHHHRELERLVLAFLGMDKLQPTLIHNLTTLKPLIHERLRTLPTEESDREKHILRVKEKQIINSVSLAKLEKMLQEAESEKTLELENLNEDLRKLKSDLYQLEQFTEEQIRRTKNDIEKQNLSDSKNSESRQKKLAIEMNKVGVKHGIVLITNRDEEDTLRQKLANIEQQIVDWIDKYDEEADKLQTDLDQVNEDYDELKKNHNELKEKFSILSVDYEKIMEERRIEHEKRERERREIEEKTTAAEVIQAYFRSYKVRKLLKGKGKKGIKERKGNKKLGVVMQQRFHDFMGWQ